MLADDSPLHRLPTELNQRQFKFLNGIRYALEMTHVSFVDLQDRLLTISRLDRSEPLPELMMASVFVDAWAMVDSINRFRVLGKTLFEDSQESLELDFDDFRLVRNSVQHLSERLEDLQYVSDPVWGSLSWVHLESPSEMIVHVLVPGALRREKGLPVVNPAGRSISYPVGLVELSAFGTRVSLSDAYDSLLTAASYIEEQLRSQFAGLDTAEADLHLTIRMNGGGGPDRTPGKQSED